MRYGKSGGERDCSQGDSRPRPGGGIRYYRLRVGQQNICVLLSWATNEMS